MIARSLKRRLKEMGNSYSQLLDEARFHDASRMLKDPDITITEISQHLNYSDSTPAILNVVDVGCAVRTTCSITT